MTDNLTDLPEWLREEGARVAIETHGYSASTYNTDIVERFTASQIVLANGRKFWRKNLREVGRAGGKSELVDPRLPRVKDYQAKRLVDLMFEEIDLRRSGKFGRERITDPRKMLAFIADQVEATRDLVARVYGQEG